MSRSLHRRSGALALLGAAVLAPRRPAAAGPGLATPTGEVILTISGRIGTGNRAGAAVFDRAMLEALGMKAFTTATPWYDAPSTFEGVPMARLMEVVGAEGETVTALALNDYATELPMSDFARFGVLLAIKRNGAYMPVRDKGPLFIVYPFDSDPELRTRRYYSRSAWQLAQLVVG